MTVQWISLPNIILYTRVSYSFSFSLQLYFHDFYLNSLHQTLMSLVFACTEPVLNRITRWYEPYHLANDLVLTRAFPTEFLRYPGNNSLLRNLVRSPEGMSAVAQRFYRHRHVQVCLGSCGRSGVSGLSVDPDTHSHITHWHLRTDRVCRLTVYSQICKRTGRSVTAPNISPPLLRI